MKQVICCVFITVLMSYRSVFVSFSHWTDPLCLSLHSNTQLCLQSVDCWCLSTAHFGPCLWKSEATLKGIPGVYWPTAPYDPDPLQGFSRRLPDPSCAIVCEGISRYLTRQPHRLTRSFSLCRRRAQWDARNICKREQHAESQSHLIGF